MYIEQLYTKCLSEAAYYIESNGEAAIIDPLRDVDQYVELAAKRNATIKYIFETHFHADFVSGHLDLASITGAKIIYGPDTETELNVYIAKDEELFPLGDLSIKVLHTPGHTLESSCFLLLDKEGKEHAIFTGDTLFVGDVGRPDLAQKGEEITIVHLAGMLYDSLQTKIMPLNDEVILYPGHGAGSSCGKNLGAESFSTIGEQKEHNYALKAASKEEFIEAVTSGLPAPPQYFPINAKINKEGYLSMTKLMENANKPLSVAEFKELLKDDDTILLDTRHASIFVNGFVPGAIFIGLEGRFAEWAGALLPFDKNILLVTEPGMEKETITRLARVGYEKIIGYLDGGYNSWKDANEKIDLLIDVEADELAMDLKYDENLLIIDVRKEAEYNDEHITEALNIPLNDLMDPASMVNLEENYNIYIHCAGGYRSVIASSLIKRQGIHNIRNVVGGFEFIKKIEGGFTFEKTKAALN
jgi:hydroxyacylglutathione hydrolase